jgi:hypothetical protein
MKARKIGKTPAAAALLKGWQQIAEFLGEPVSVVERWAAEGMPVSHQGRFVTAVPAELDAWFGRESGKPVHVVTPDTDLSAELKRGLSFVRSGKAQATKTSPPPAKAKR